MHPPPAKAAVNLPADEKADYDCPACPEMVAIPGRNYEIGKYEVTLKQWRDVMGSDPLGLRFKGCDDCPVEMVSWDDIQEFLAKLNSKARKQYRLPTEAEWEYACYGGKQAEYCGGNDIGAVAWYRGNSGGETHPVGQKQTNGYGLYDMSGNVWEWVQDKYNSKSNRRVLRGASLADFPQSARAANRSTGNPEYRRRNYGFRLARTLP